VFWVRSALVLLAQNVNLVLFLCGFGVLYVGLSSLSRPWANVIAGSLVMVAALWPYLRLRKS
jgi:hypothetical protein